MSFKKVSIKNLSPRQIRLLRQGKKVRINQAPVEGGTILIVYPENFDIISKTFRKNKGLNISLDAPEIEANSVEGTGIFGRKFDRWLNKTLNKVGLSKAKAPVEKFLKKNSLKLIKTGSKQLQKAIVPLATTYGVPPELIYPAQKSISLGERYLSSYIDKPQQWQDNPKQMALNATKEEAIDAIKEQFEPPSLEDAISGMGCRKVVVMGKGLYASGGSLQSRNVKYIKNVGGDRAGFINPNFHYRSVINNSEYK